MAACALGHPPPPQKCIPCVVLSERLQGLLGLVASVAHAPKVPFAPVPLPEQVTGRFNPNPPPPSSHPRHRVCSHCTYEGCSWGGLRWAPTTAASNGGGAAASSPPTPPSSTVHALPTSDREPNALSRAPPELSAPQTPVEVPESRELPPTTRLSTNAITSASKVVESSSGAPLPIPGAGAAGPGGVCGDTHGAPGPRTPRGAWGASAAVSLKNGPGMRTGLAAPRAPVGPCPWVGVGERVRLGELPCAVRMGVTTPTAVAGVGPGSAEVAGMVRRERGEALTRTVCPPVPPVCVTRATISW